MTRGAPRSPVAHRRRALSALLTALAVVAFAGCSDAPTEKEIAMADDGIDPSVALVFTSEELLPIVQELGTVFLVDHRGTTFQYVTDTPEVLGQRIRDGVQPVLWVDEASVLEPFADGDSDARTEPVGADELVFIVAKSYRGDTPTLDDFGAGDTPVRTALCEDAAPCGRAAHDLLTGEGIEPDPGAWYPSGRDVITSFADEATDAALVYRSDAARLYTRFRFEPLPDPTFAAHTYQSLHFADGSSGEQFAQWIATSADADEILTKRGLRPLPGQKEP